MRKLLSLTLVVILTAVAAAEAQSYDFHQLPVPGPIVVVQDVNNAGLVAGWWFFPPFSASAWVADLSDFTAYDFPGAAVTIFNGINESGELSGHFVDGAGSHGFLLDKKGGTTVVDFPGAEGGSWTFDINNNGSTTGLYCDNPVTFCSGEPVRGYTRNSRGEFSTIDFPGAVLTAALGNNERGQVVGVYEDSAGDSHGFVWSKKTGFTTIDVPGAVFTEAIGINARGDIVGDYVDSAGVLHGYVRLKSGELITIDYPGSAGTYVSGINDRGDLAGVFIDPNTSEELGFFADRN